MEPLDHDGAVGGQGPTSVALLGKVVEQVARCPVIEPCSEQPLGGPFPGLCVEITHQRPDRGPELRWAPEGVALPEGQPAGHARGGRHHHLVVGDVLDAPAGGTQREDVADPRLVDHLLVELADPTAASLADEEDPEEPAVGNGAAAGDGQPLCAGPPGDLAGDAVPHDAWAQLGELVAGITAAQQVESGLEGRARQRREGGGAAYECEELVDVPGVDRGGRDDLLGQHVEWVGGDAHRLDGAGAHALDRHCRGSQVAAVLGKEHTS
uniref:hypothetical protein n=1 Tax=Nocardioides alcanivorans TaxID=2897352 RepID=UPI0028A29C5C|nr:hypothetical protein [Nocardioides alcanivorans]